MTTTTPIVRGHQVDRKAYCNAPTAPYRTLTTHLKQHVMQGHHTVDAPTSISCKPPKTYHRRLVWLGRAVKGIQITGCSRCVRYFGYLSLAFKLSLSTHPNKTKDTKSRSIVTLAASIGVSGTEDGSAGGVSSRTYWSIYAEAVPPLPAVSPICSNSMEGGGARTDVWDA